MRTPRAKYSLKEAFYPPPPPCVLQTRNELTPNSSDETWHLCVRLQPHLNAVFQIHGLNFSPLLTNSEFKTCIFIWAFMSHFKPGYEIRRYCTHTGLWTCPDSHSSPSVSAHRVEVTETLYRCLIRFLSWGPTLHGVIWTKLQLLYRSAVIPSVAQSRSRISGYLFSERGR